MVREITRADADLSAALAARGVEASARKLERLRQWGLLGDALHVGLGRGLGSRSVRPDALVERAAAACTLASEHRGYPRAVLAMFAQGEYRIPKDKLDAAYRAEFEAALRLIEKRGGQECSPTAAAARAAGWAARYAAKDREYGPWRRRLRELSRERFAGARDARFESVRWLLTSALTDVLLVMLTGRVTSRQGLKELVDGLGLPQLLASPHTGESEPYNLGELDELTPHMSLASVECLVTASSLETLEQARDDIKGFVSFARVYGTFIRRAFGWRWALPWLFIASFSDVTVAYAAPVMIWIRQRRGSELENFHHLTAEWTPRFAAFNHVLDYLPVEYNVLAKPKGLDELGEDRARHLRDRLHEFETEFPAEHELIMSASTVDPDVR